MSRSEICFQKLSFWNWVSSGFIRNPNQSSYKLMDKIMILIRLENIEYQSE